MEQQILEELQLDTQNPTAYADGQSEAPWSAKYSSFVLVKRYTKADESEIAKAQREITALLAVKSFHVPELLDYFDPSDGIWVVMRDSKDQTLRRYVENNGSLSEDMLKSLMNQLFSAIATIFMAGFAHLRICNETLYIDDDSNLTLKGFEYAHEYSKEKDEETGLYAATSARYGSDIYVAPEVYAQTTFNARKATIWGCGVSIYYMTTGQTEKLSNLEHPAFESSKDTSVSHANVEPATEEPPPPPSPRRTSFASFSGRRRSSAANSGSHSRKASLAQAANLITYPGSRLEVPSYIRDIISKMLTINPLRRAELIEVAAKVPKEVHMKSARPLMELAWVDYKEHVGPMAGLTGNDDGDRLSFSSSMFSGVSNMSNPFASLLGGRRKSSAAVIGGRM